jgi:antitoxin YqcF
MATEKLTSLPEHYERNLGNIARGWSDDKRMHGVQIVCFERQPEQGVKTYATLGLSRHIVESPRSRHVRQELLISANEAFASDAVAGLVLSLAEHVLQRGKALLRGEVIGPGAPVVAGSTLVAIYVTNPSPFEKSLTEFVSEPPATVFAYLVPITEAEALLVRERGWQWFEEQLEQQNPDIWDLARTESIQARA